MPTYKPERWWSRDLKSLDPKLRVVWGQDSIYGIPRWVVEREVDPSFFKDWNAERYRTYLESGRDMGPRPTHIDVLVVEDEHGNFLQFGRFVIDFLREHDTWAKRDYRGPKEYAKIKHEAQLKYRERMRLERVNNLAHALTDLGYRTTWIDGGKDVRIYKAAKNVSKRSNI